MTRHERGLLDTNALIQLDRLEDASELPGTPLISTITLAELSVGPLVTDDEEVRAARLAHLQEAGSAFDPLPFDAAAARAFGRVAASLRRSGRRSSARAFDTMIAAVAIANDLPLYTFDARDCAGIDGLELIRLEPSRG